MLARTALARLRAQAPRSSARDVAHISRQLAHTYLTSTTATTQLATAPAVKTFRSYATATKTKPKPKSTTKKVPAKKTATRKTAAKKKPVKKAVKKPVKKTAAKKPIKKAAPKRKPLTERQKLLKEKAKVRENIAQLKVAALEEPKKLPANGWAIYLGEFYNNLPQGHGEKVTEVLKKASTEFKTLPSSELERLQKQAADNVKRNNEAYKKFVNSYTPQQIYEANKARVTLKKKLAAYKKNKLQDDRLVKAPRGPFVYFFLEKRGSVEGSPSEKAKQAGQEWRALSAAQKQKYEDIARQDTQRYIKQYKSLYGEEPQVAKKAVQ
ncbi:uncharacterized protein J3D65DRAFT_403932 [Phyllosticta citribraziliensis]|uniref:HMG box domain-containing protein n=1 Tax=Phyllosticta citribraziliensis TaxID=989973 RepID=A0ABR1LN62_9PEZI